MDFTYSLFRIADRSPVMENVSIEEVNLFLRFFNPSNYFITITDLI